VNWCSQTRVSQFRNLLVERVAQKGRALPTINFIVGSEGGRVR